VGGSFAFVQRNWLEGMRKFDVGGSFTFGWRRRENSVQMDRLCSCEDIGVRQQWVSDLTLKEGRAASTVYVNL
jgi:hypothetical protein